MVIEILSIALPLIFTNNIVMSVVKRLAGKAAGTVWLRCILGGLSILGAISLSAFTGNPIDYNQLSELGKMLIEAIVAGVGAHYSYQIIKYA